FVVSASHDGTMRVWDATQENDVTLRGHPSDIRTITYSPDGRVLATGGQDGSVRLWDPNSGAAGEVFRGHTEPVTRVAFLGGNEHVASASNDLTVRIWNAQAPNDVRRFQHETSLADLDASADGARIVSSGVDGIVRVWDVASGRAIVLATHGVQVQSVSM